MAEYKLQYKSKLTKQQAKDKICAHAMFGNHGISPKPKTPQQVQAYFLKMNINTDLLIQEYRDPKKIVPDFENLIRSTWKATGNEGFSVSLVDKNNKEVTKLNKPGLFIWSNYEAHFEAACNARDRAIQTSSYQDFLECLSQGFASIEAFFTVQSEIWNKSHPDDLLLDSKKRKVNIENKINEWLPKMSDGNQIDKSGQVWYNFKILKNIRDNTAIHPKLAGQAISWEDFANQINLFRLGIAQLLANIHCILGLTVPSIIINAIYVPDVEVITIS